MVLPHLTVEATSEASRPRPRGGWRGVGPKGSHSHPVLSALCAGLGLAAPVPTSHGMSWVLSWVPINTPSCRGGDGCTEESQAHGEAEVGTPRPSHPEARNRGPGAQCQRQEDPYLLRPCPTRLGWAGGRAVLGSKGQRPKGILFRAWDRLSPNVSPLPADAAAGWDLCFDQAVVFIEDAIQVGGASLRWLGPGSSPGPWGLGNGRPDGPVTLRHPGAKAEVGKPCGPRNRHGLAFGHGLFESLLEQVGA